MILSLAKRLAAAAIAALAFVVPASATSYSVDFSDMWWNENESGWGINFTQQADVIFATMFVYGPDQTPRWYVASALTPNSSGGTTFNGTLYRTTGPYFGTAWSGTAQVTPVGSMTVAFSGQNAATLNYNVDGVNVVKNITRQTLRANNASGNFLGGVVADTGTCAAPGDDIGALFVGRYVATHSGNTLGFTITWTTGSGAAAVCTYSGAITQQGKLASVSGGTFNCRFDGVLFNQGTFSLGALDVTANGMSATFTGQDQYCTYSGRFGGVRDVQ